jgi:hypothetical protein
VPETASCACQVLQFRVGQTEPLMPGWDSPPFCQLLKGLRIGITNEFLR